MNAPDFRCIEENYEKIKNEFLQVQNKMGNWIEPHLYNKDGWNVYPIYDWPSGDEMEEFTYRVPFTASLIKKCVPNHGGVCFSRLKAHSYIKPHKGIESKFLRYHLGIDVPYGDCTLKCSDKIIKWENGKSFIFDDRKTHEAWNRTNQDRIVLIIDFAES